MNPNSKEFLQAQLGAMTRLADLAKDDPFMALPYRQRVEELKLELEEIENENPHPETEIEPPSEIAKELAKSFVSMLISNNILHFKMSTLGDGGIGFRLNNKSKLLHFEIYNNGELGYITENRIQKKSLYNKDCKTLSEATREISNFLKEMRL